MSINTEAIRSYFPNIVDKAVEWINESLLDSKTCKKVHFSEKVMVRKIRNENKGLIPNNSGKTLRVFNNEEEIQAYIETKANRRKKTKDRFIESIINRALEAIYQEHLKSNGI